MIGYSERTEKITIERLAEALRNGGSAVKRILVVAIPPAARHHAPRHVFTRLSEGECLCHGPMVLAGRSGGSRRLRGGPHRARGLVDHEGRPPLRAPGRHGIDLEPIPCGGDDPSTSSASSGRTARTSSRSRPGLVLGYDRNIRTADELRAARLPRSSRTTTSFSGARRSSARNRSSRRSSCRLRSSPARAEDPAA